MPTKTISFTVAPGEGIQAYWIQIGEVGVPLVNGRGTIPLEAPGTHILIWWMKGNPGSTIGVTGRHGRTLVVEVKESRVPPDELEGAGIKRFELT